MAKQPGVILFPSPKEALAYLADNPGANVALTTTNKAQADMWARWHPNLPIHDPGPPVLQAHQDVLDLFGPA